MKSGGEPIVAGGDAAELLELVEEPFDAVAFPVKGCVMGDGDLAAASGGKPTPDNCRPIGKYIDLQKRGFLFRSQSMFLLALH